MPTNMDTVKTFFTKNGDEYERLYRLDHGPRIRALLDRYDLVNQLKGKRVIDVGGGQGFLGEMLEPVGDMKSNYIVLDGADVPEEKQLCRGLWRQLDLDRDSYAEEILGARDVDIENGGDFGIGRLVAADAAFFLETIEHLQSPYHAIVQLKDVVKQDGDIFISTPTETVWHNTPYPSLFWPPQSFAQWLGQMALPIVDFYVYEPKERGWPAYQYRCRNAAWTEAVMLYPKQEAKFIGKKPHEYANL